MMASGLRTMVRETRFAIFSQTRDRQVTGR
jgi:hypothetical protein